MPLVLVTVSLTGSEQRNIWVDGLLTGLGYVKEYKSEVGAYKLPEGQWIKNVESPNVEDIFSDLKESMRGAVSQISVGVLSDGNFVAWHM